MRYDKYVNKMKTALATRRYISRHKILIMAIAAVVLVLTLSLLFTAGTVTKIEVPTEFVYGEQIEVKGSALFKKVSYEYLAEGSDEWTSEEPTTPGTYQVRVASEKLIGKTSYSKPVEFIIKPKEVEVSVVAGTIEFGDKPSLSADLEEGDKFVYAEFVYENFASNKTTASVVIESIIVHDENGNDVTNAYTFVNKSGEISFTSRNINVSIPSVSKVYDGTPLTSNEYTLKDSTLIENHIGILTTNASITNVGTIKNVVSSFNIMDGELDVASNYNISYEVGNLTIEKRPILVVTKSATKEYDGSELTCNDLEISKDSYDLVEGHTYKIVSSTNITNAGSVENVLEIKIFDAENNDVTDNYDISYEYGTLTVNKLEIGITTQSASKLYDGKPLSDIAYDYTLNSKHILLSHKFELVDYAVITNVGRIENKNELKIVDGSGLDMSSNYNIIYTNGSLVINSKDITIKTPTASKAYDGTKLEALDYEVEGIYDTFEVEIVESPSITEVGEITNKIIVKILDDKKVDVTDEFAINYEYGKLTVIPQTIYLSLLPKVKVYDGTALTSSEWDYSHDNLVEFVDGAKVTITTSGEITKVGEVSNKLSGYKIVYNNKDITNCYTVQADPSTLTITEREIDINVNSVDKVYDGKALTSNAYTTTSNTKVVRGETLTIITDGTVTYVNEGEVVNTMTSFKVVNEAGEDVSYCYKVNATPGTLKINVVEVSITVVSKEKVYDGTPLTSTDWEYTKNTTGRILEDDTNLTITTDGSITYYTSLTNGVAYNNVTDWSLLVDDKELKDNYSFEFIPGTLAITQRIIDIKIKDATRPYDGTALTSKEYEFINDTSLIEGDIITIETNGSVTYVNDKNTLNELSNHVIMNDGVDVTESYKLTPTPGTLTITPRNVEIELLPESKEYDGTALTSTKWVYSSGFEDTIKEIIGDKEKLVLTTSGSITYYTNENNGVVDNELLDYSLIIDGKELKSNYIITAVPSTLTITKRQVNIVIKSASKTYDGSFLTMREFDVVDKNVATGDTLSITTDGSIKNVGSITNSMTSYKVVNSIGEDVSLSYVVSATPGTLTIDKAEYILATVSAGKNYDGLPYYNETNYEAALINSVINFNNGVIEEVKIETYNQDMTLRGSYENEVKVKIVDKDGIPTTSNYNIVEAYGYITIADKIINVDINDRSKSYDGLPYFNESNIDIIKDYFKDLPTDEELVLNINENVNVGKYYAHNFIDIDILDKDGNSLLNNYGIVINGSVTINRKVVDLKVFSGSKDYDGLPYFNEDNLSFIYDTFKLPSNETLEITLNNNPINVGEYIAADVVNINIIRDTNGTLEDVTSFYQFYVAGSVNINKKKITITRHDKTIEYNGLPYYNNEIINSIESNITGLANGERLEINLLDNPSKVGSYEGLIQLNEIDILDKDNNSTKSNYSITINPGKITITKKQITVTTFSDSSKTYDGESFDVVPGLEEDLTKVVVAEGHIATIDYNSVKTSIINAGTYTNTMTIIIKDSNGELVTDNYNINYKYGLITINKKVLEIKTFGGTKDYNGLPYYDNNKVFNDIIDRTNNEILLASGNVEYIVMDGYNTEMVNVGTYQNYAVIGVVDKDDNPTHNNYEFKYDFGTITINPAKVHININDVVKTYDGTPLTIDNGSLTTNNAYSFVAGSNVFETNYELIIKTSGSITYYHEGVNGVINNSVEKITYLVYGVDYTYNYDFIVDYSGTLTINKQNLTVNILDVTKTYNGQEQTSTDYQIVGEYYDKFSITTKGSRTDIGTVKLEKDTYTITNLKGVDVSSSYNIIWNDGQLTISAIYLEISYINAGKDYDGKPYFTYNDSVEKFINFNGTLADGQKLVIDRDTINLDIIDYKEGGYINNVKFMIVNANGDDVTNNYHIPEYQYGNIVINKIELIIETKADNLYVYNGEAYYTEFSQPKDILKNTTTSLGENIIPTKWNLDMVDAGSYTNSIEYRIEKTDGSPSTHNYEITTIFNDIVIQPKPIKFSVVSDKREENVYDGKDYFTRSDSTYISDEVNNYLNNEMVGNDYFELDTKNVPEMINAGNYTYSIDLIIKDKNGINVTSNYDIKCLPGEIEIRKVTLDVEILDQNKEYDGQPLNIYQSDFDYTKYITITNGALIPNELLTIDYSDMEDKTDFGSYLIVYRYNFTKANGEVSDNYFVNVTNGGTLTIDPITVYIKLVDKVVVYNGDYHTSVEYVYNHTSDNENKFVDGASINLNTTGKIATVGSVENALKENGYKIYNKDGQDITHSYNVIAEPGTITVTAAEVVIEIMDDNKPYDGTALTPRYKVEGLIGNDKLTFVPTATATYVSDGVVECDLDKDNSRIIHPTLGDVTNCYNIKVTKGNLQITKQTLEVSYKDYCAPYTGEKIIIDVKDINKLLQTTNGLASNEKIEIVEIIYDNIINVGTHQIIVKLAVKNGNVDTTDNYDFDNEITLNVIITPEDVILNDKLTNVTIEYGEELDLSTDLSNLETYLDQVFAKNNHHYEIDVEYFDNDGNHVDVVNAGNYYYKIALNIYDESNNLVNSNYNVICDLKTIIINPKEIVIESFDLDKIYDGKTYYNQNKYLDITPYLRHSGLDSSKGETLKIDVDSIDTTNMINVGTYENRVSLKVFVGDKDVTANYTFNYVTVGTITIDPRPIVVKTYSVSKSYDGKAYYTDLEYLNGDSIEGISTVLEGTALIGPDYLEIESYKAHIDAGEYDNEVIVKVRNDFGYSNNYEINYEYGKLTITKRDIFVMPYAEKVYQAMDIDLSKESDLYQLENGSVIADIDKLSITINLKERKVGTHTITTDDFDVAITKKSDSTIDRSSNYNIKLLSGELVIIPLDITVVLNPAEKYYDGSPLTFEGMPLPTEQWDFLNEGIGLDESLTFETTGSQTVTGNGEYSVIDGSYKVLSADGDYTDCYNITFKTGTLIVKGRTITVTTKVGNKPYDGTPCFESGVENDLLGNLVESFEVYGATVIGNKIYFEDGSYETIKVEAIDSFEDCVNVGTYYNRIKYSIYNGETETTDNYIGNSTTNVMMEVTPRVIEYTAESYNRPYNGQPLFTVDSNDDEFIKNTEMFRLSGLVMEGHTLAINKYNVNTDIINSGTYFNDIPFVVYDGEEKVTENYQFILKEGTGIINITKIQIPYSTNSDSVPYDGKSYYREDNITDTEKYIIFDKDKLVTGEKVVIDLDSTESMIEVGIDYVNDVKFYVINETTLLQSDNYEFVIDKYGTITRTITDLIVEAITDESYVYNGNYYYVKNITEDNSRYYSNVEGLIPGDEIVINYATVKDMIDAGSYVNEFEVMVYRNGVDISKYYNINVKPGIIKINPLEITVSPNIEKTYIGDYIDLSNENSNVDYIGENRVADIDELVVTVNFKAKNASDTPYEFDENQYEVSIRRKDGNTPNVDNYIITKEKGHMVINKASVTVELLSASKTYDGSTLTFEGNYLPSNQFNLIGDVYEGKDNLKFMVEGNISTVDSTIYKQVGEVKVLVGEDDYSDNYEFTFIDGTLRIEPRNVNFKTKYGTKTYDGKPYFDVANDDPFDKLISGLSIDGVSLNPDHTFVMSDKTYKVELIVSDLLKTNVDVYDYYNLYEILEFMVTLNGENVTDQFLLNCTTEQISITPKEITYSTEKGVKTYDGLPFYNSTTPIKNIVKNYEGFVANFEGHTVKAEFNQEMIDASSYNNIVDFTIIRNSDGKDVTYNYNITNGEIGIIEIKPLELTIQSPNVDKTYDGLPYYTSNIRYENDITYTGLRTTDKITFTKPNQDADVGVYSNEFEYSITIKVDGIDQDITRNYSIKVQWGTITINKLNLNITTESKHFDYDGTTHNHYVFTDDFYKQLPKGLSIVVNEEESAKISVPGLVTNKVVFDLYFEKDGTNTKVSKDNYQLVTENYGNLDMTARVQISTSNLSKVFDFNKLEDTSNPTIEVLGVSDEFKYSLPTGHNLEINDRSSIVYVHESGTYNEFSYYISGCEDWNKYYTIIESWGKLTINKSDLYIEVSPTDQTSKFMGSKPVVDQTLTHSLPDGVNIYSYQCDIAEVKNAYRIGTYTIKVNSLVFSYGDQHHSIEQLESSVNITVNTAIYTITVDDNHFIKSNDLSKPFDFSPLTANNSFTTSIDSKFNVIVGTSGTVSKVGVTVEHEIIFVRIEYNGEDVTDCFDFETINGTLSIYTQK